MSTPQHVDFSLRAKIGEILLQRPEELNALSLAMIEAIDAQLAEWASDPAVIGVTIRGAGGEAFCAGIDQRALYHALKDNDREFGRTFFRRFYQLLHRLATYPKPVAAVMHGITMGGGVALAMNCRIRVGTRQTYCALADGKIGFFPDGGLATLLGRCPGEIGMFLALTGVAVRARALVYAGLATHLVPEDRVALVTPLLVDQLAVPPPLAPLADMEPLINQVFGLSSPREIVAILSVRGTTWAKGTLEQLQPQSPTSLALTFRHLRAAKGKPPADVLRIDYRLSQNLLDGHDFREGMRAIVIDRDNKPAWQPADLAGVTAEQLDSLFRPVAAEWSAAAG
jgi:enoyl-CoA hydratase/carnithine racemase